MSYEKPSKAEVHMILDAWHALHEENKRLREGLELAREWLKGWGSAEPYLTKIQTILDTPSPSQPT